jgi:hypothetical protein
MLETGLVVDQTFFDIVKGAMVCEEQQQFKNTPRQILNMDETTYNDQNFFDTMEGAKVSKIWLKGTEKTPQYG